jgi:hypothetical protein
MPGDPRRSLSGAVEALRQDRYMVREMSDDLQAVPEDADALVLAGRQAPMSDALVASIQDFVSLDGGRLLVLADPGTDKPDEALNRVAGPNLRIRTDAVAVSTVISAYGQTRAVTRVPVGFSSQDHSIVTNLAGLPMEFSQACPLQVVDTSGTAVETEPVLFLVSSASTGWGETDLDAALGPGGAAVSFTDHRDIPHPVVIGAAVAAPEAGPFGTLGPPEPRKVILGSTATFTDAGLARTNGNRQVEDSPAAVLPPLELLRNSVNWLVRDAALPDITPRILNVQLTVMSHERIVRLLVAFLGLLPLAVVVLGITVWRLRRR